MIAIQSGRTVKRDILLGGDIDLNVVDRVSLCTILCVKTHVYTHTYMYVYVAGELVYGLI